MALATVSIALVSRTELALWFLGYTTVIVSLAALAIAAMPSLRPRPRVPSTRELVEHIKPLSNHAREVIDDNTQGNVPETWLEFGDLYRTAQNLTWMTVLADRFKRALDGCTDSYILPRGTVTHRTFMRNRTALWRYLAVGFAHSCLGRIGKRHSCVHMANVAREYTYALLSVRDMAESMDPGCERLLDGQFLEPLS